MQHSFYLETVLTRLLFGVCLVQYMRNIDKCVSASIIFPLEKSILSKCMERARWVFNRIYSAVHRPFINMLVAR